MDARPMVIARPWIRRSPEALLRVPAAWLIHTREGRRRGVAAEAITEDGDGRSVGLVHALAGGDDERSAGAPRVTGGPLVRTPHGWMGEGWSLESHPAARVRLRPWTWLHGESWHGTRLVIRHGRSTDEAQTWLLGQTPPPREETAPGRFEDALERERRARIEVADERLEFLRSVAVSDALIACESPAVDLAAHDPAPIDRRAAYKNAART